MREKSFDLSKIKIEKGIEISTRAKGGILKNLLNKMKPGDSVQLPKTQGRNFVNIGYALGFKMVQRSNGNGALRVWKVGKKK